MKCNNCGAKLQFGDLKSSRLPGEKHRYTNLVCKHCHEKPYPEKECVVCKNKFRYIGVMCPACRSAAGNIAKRRKYLDRFQENMLRTEKLIWDIINNSSGSAREAWDKFRNELMPKILDDATKCEYGQAIVDACRVRIRELEEKIGFVTDDLWSEIEVCEVVIDAIHKYNQTGGRGESI